MNEDYGCGLNLRTFLGKNHRETLKTVTNMKPTLHNTTSSNSDGYKYERLLKMFLTNEMPSA